MAAPVVDGKHCSDFAEIVIVRVRSASAPAVRSSLPFPAAVDSPAAMIQASTDSLDRCWLDFDSALAGYGTICLSQWEVHISLAEVRYHFEALLVEDLGLGVPAVAVSCSTSENLEASAQVAMEAYCRSSMD